MAHPSPGADVASPTISLARTGEGAMGRADRPAATLSRRLPRELELRCRWRATPRRLEQAESLRALLETRSCIATSMAGRSREPRSLHGTGGAAAALPGEDEEQTLSNKRMELTIASVGGCASFLLRLQLIRETLDGRRLCRGRAPQ